MPWERPSNVPFPTVWERFQGKVLIDGKPLSYSIQDVTEDIIQPVVDHMCRYFLIRETMMSSLGIVEDETSLKEVRDVWTDLLHRKMALVALVDGDEPPSKRIAGCNILYVSQKNDTPFKVQGKPLEILFRSMGKFYEEADLYERYNVDTYLNAFGLSVSPQYQGDNIGYYLLKSRTNLCLATGLTLTVTCFSHPAAIHEALKAGFKIISDTTLDKLELDNKTPYPRLKSRFVLTSKIIPKSE